MLSPLDKKERQCLHCSREGTQKKNNVGPIYTNLSGGIMCAQGARELCEITGQGRKSFFEHFDVNWLIPYIYAHYTNSAKWVTQKVFFYFLFFYKLNMCDVKGTLLLAPLVFNCHFQENIVCGSDVVGPAAI